MDFRATGKLQFFTGQFWAFVLFLYGDQWKKCTRCFYSSLKDSWQNGAFPKEMVWCVFIPS